MDRIRTLLPVALVAAAAATATAQPTEITSTVNISGVQSFPDGIIISGNGQLNIFGDSNIRIGAGSSIVIDGPNAGLLVDNTGGGVSFSPIIFSQGFDGIRVNDGSLVMTSDIIVSIIGFRGPAITATGGAFVRLEKVTASSNITDEDNKDGIFLRALPGAGSEQPDIRVIDSTIRLLRGADGIDEGSTFSRRNAGNAIAFDISAHERFALESVTIKDLEGGNGGDAADRSPADDGMDGIDGTTNTGGNGTDGTNGANGSTGLAGGRGGEVIAIRVFEPTNPTTSRTEVDIFNTVIERLFAGDGGDGGRGGDGGDGGNGGDGLDAFQDPGNGGDGGDGGNAGSGGNAGTAGDVVAFAIDNTNSLPTFPANANFGNNTVADLRAGNAGTPGLPGQPGTAGRGGAAGEAFVGSDGRRGTDGDPGDARNPGNPAPPANATGVDALSSQVQNDYGTVAVVNSVFTGFQAAGNAVGFLNNGRARARNNIFDTAVAISNLAPSGTFFQDIGNISTDPMLDGILIPLDGSPAINAGDNDLRPVDAADLNGNGQFEEVINNATDRDGNPRIRFGTTDIGAFETPFDAPACPADLAAPFGTLNFFDISAFIGLFNAGDASADFAAPFGSLNFFDVAEYIALFNAGCP